MNNLIKFNPILKNHDVFNVMDEIFNKSLSDIMSTNAVKSQPQINIKESDKAYELEVAAPGLKKEDFKVTLDNDHLTISAEMSTENVEEGAEYKRREFNYSSFSRSYYLPDAIDSENIKAKYDNGILSIEVPKVEVKEPEGKTIEIV